MPASSPYISHLRFTQALIVVRSIPEQEVGLQPIPTDRLKFYGLYKQATFGECNTPKPSSRNVVEYAKWKAWYRVRHHSCMEAKNLYVNALVELLVEFIIHYPNNPHHDFAKNALHSLESNVASEADGTDYARKSTSFMPENSLAPHDTTPSYSTNSSWISRSPSLQASTTPSSVTTHNNNEPWTPILSPQQQQHHALKSATPSNQMMSLVMDCTTPPAATGAYRIYATSEQHRISSLTTTTTTTPSSGKEKNVVDYQQQNDKQVLLLSEQKALEKLDMEITALAKQMNQLGQDILLQHGEPKMKRHNYMIKLGWRIVKTLFRHLFVNTLMTGFVFWILWHQQSPTAHAMVDFLTPHIKALIRSSIKKTVFFGN